MLTLLSGKWPCGHVQLTHPPLVSRALSPSISRAHVLPSQGNALIAAKFGALSSLVSVVLPIGISPASRSDPRRNPVRAPWDSLFWA